MLNSNRNYYLLSCSLILLLIAAIYAPSLSLPFARDDFAFLGKVAVSDSIFSTLLVPQLEHLLPARQALFYYQYQFFGAEPFGYSVISLLIHLSVTAGLMRWVHLLFQRQELTIVSGALFGLASAHSRSVAWISVQGQLIGGLFLIIFFVQLEQWIKTGRLTRLLLVFISILLLPLSFSVGPELLFLAPLYCYIRSDTNDSRKRVLASIIPGIVVLVAIGFVLLLRAKFIPPGNSSIAIESIISRLFLSRFEVVYRIGLALIAQPLPCATGVIIIYDTFPRRYQSLLVSFIVLAAVSYCFDWRKARKEKSYPLLMFFALACFSFYLLPVIARIDFSKWFIGLRPRYSYFPMLFSSVIFGYYYTSVRNKSPRFILRLLLILIVLGNCYSLSLKLSDLETRKNSYTREIQKLVRDFDTIYAKKSNSAEIANDTIWIVKYPSGNWGVSLWEVCRLYRSESMCRAIIARADSTKSSNLFHWSSKQKRLQVADYSSF